ncbi:MAG: phenylalanine--tRNA ligase subunit alpha [bacterium]
MIKEKLDAIETNYKSELNSVNSILELENIRIKYVGKKSELMDILANIRFLEAEEKKEVGNRANVIRKSIEQAIDEKLLLLKGNIEKKPLKEILDITEPAVKNYVGSEHLLSQMTDDVIEVFGQFGFEFAEGPEIETDWYCFEQLNMPPEHPARDMQDTFYLDEEMHILPRTHTSSVQIRYMESHQPPLRIVVPGRVYRNEAVDARHTFMFSQFEALIVDDVTTVADCKSIITQIARRLLNQEQLEVRFRHAFFPYTEPSFEIDGTCPKCLGKSKQCSLCSNKGWLELGGLGMVHPQVLRNVGIDPDKYQGFALGFGIERFAMIRHNVDYLGRFFENDLRFNRQF